MLLCGADLLHSFDTPGVWSKEDVGGGLFFPCAALYCFLFWSLAPSLIWWLFLPASHSLSWL
jgi:hypothetical protein